MKKIVSLAACMALLVVVGCSQQTPTTVPSTTATTLTVDGSKYLLAAEPDDAVDVIKVREDAEDQDEVVIVGRIGGSENPWVDGRAAFSIVDPSLKSCAEYGSHDCPKPWDYC